MATGLMQVAVLETFGAPFRVATVARPTPDAGQVLIRIAASAATYSGVFTLLPLLTGEGRAHHGEIMRQATRLAEMGRITPKLDPWRLTLTTACNAYRAIKAPDANGKLVVGIAGTEAGLHTTHDAFRAPVPA